MRARDLRQLRQRAEELRTADPWVFEEPEDGPDEPQERKCWLCGERGGPFGDCKPWECPEL